MLGTPLEPIDLVKLATGKVVKLDLKGADMTIGDVAIKGDAHIELQITDVDSAKKEG